MRAVFNFSMAGMTCRLIGDQGYADISFLVQLESAFAFFSKQLLTFVAIAGINNCRPLISFLNLMFCTLIILFRHLSTLLSGVAGIPVSFLSIM